MIIPQVNVDRGLSILGEKSEWREIWVYVLQKHEHEQIDQFSFRESTTNVQGNIPVKVFTS